jgi:tetratricopeptide (TPR) repeat protein
LTFARKLTTIFESANTTMTGTQTEAIQAALVGDWAKAIQINQELLSENPSDIDTLNRLAFAQASSGMSKDAKLTYQKVLDLDAKNPIATKNLKRLSSLGNATAPTAMNNIFIEEPGKTKVVDLINLADSKVLIPLRFGEKLSLSVKRMKIFVSDRNKTYIGMLPDDLGKRLMLFIEGGNQYEAYVKTVDAHRVTVFIKETFRSPQFKNQQSFLTSNEKTKFIYEHHEEEAKPKKEVVVHAELEEDEEETPEEDPQRDFYQEE